MIRGYIAYSGSRYKELCGMKRAMQEQMSWEDVEIKGFINDSNDFVPRSINTIVEETNDATRLEMAYLLSYSGEVNPRQPIYSHPSTTYQTLQHLLKTSMSWRHCDGQPCQSKTKMHRIDHGENLYLTGTISKDSYNLFQKYLRALTWSQNVWILIYGQDAWFIIIDHPVLLYALISLLSGGSLSLMPFMACLDCIDARAIRLGHSHLDVVDGMEYEIDGIALKLGVEHSFTTKVIASDMSDFDLERTLLLSRGPEGSS